MYHVPVFCEYLIIFFKVFEILNITNYFLFIKKELQEILWMNIVKVIRIEKKRKKVGK